MKFARNVFYVAGVWGLVVLIPLYFMLEVIGRQNPPAITHPDFYYGFVTITLAWQIGFLVVATDPARFRPMMIAAMVEKFGYVATMCALYARGGVELGQLAVTSPDLIFGLLFVAAFIKTPAIPI
jgi:hypothetical protein